jgi:DNA-binding GntR family transcriptional regulator
LTPNEAVSFGASCGRVRRFRVRHLPGYSACGLRPLAATQRLIEANDANHSGHRLTMKTLQTQPKLVEQVHKAILTEIAEGKIPPGTRIIQEQIALQLGVSRQPVQQALLLLRNQGVLHDAPGRGLLVVPMDLDYVRSMYDMRAVIEGLACRNAAQFNSAAMQAKGAALIRAGRKAVAAGSVRAMIAADTAFHQFIYTLSNNPLIAPAMESHWISTQRVMGEVLLRDEKPRDIWDQHEAIYQAIAAADASKAERLARQHILQAADFMIGRLRKERDQVAPEPG